MKEIFCQIWFLVFFFNISEGKNHLHVNSTVRFLRRFNTITTEYYLNCGMFLKKKTLKLDPFPENYACKSAMNSLLVSQTSSKAVHPF